MLDHPLRLAVGSHQAGSGKGCAMNAISWENGDTTITDLPACADPVLARIVQRVNDSICTHRDGDLLCPSCSVKVLALAHRTVGTGGPADLDRRRVWAASAAAYAAAYAASAASAAASAASRRLELAHRAIDLFLRLTGIAEHQPTPERTERAYAAMTARS